MERKGSKNARCSIAYFLLPAFVAFSAFVTFVVPGKRPPCSFKHTYVECYLQQEY